MSSRTKALKTTFVLQCNGAPALARPPGRRDPAPELQHLATYGRATNVVLKIADITDWMAERLPAVVVDLLEIAALVYAADQCCRRTPGRRFDYGQRWHRVLNFQVAVRCPDFWGRQAVRDALGETLHFLSEDDYEFNFHQAQAAPPLPEYLDFETDAAIVSGIEQVMLMSGGLDSLAGAAKQVIHEKRKVAMVSHRPVSHMGSRQRQLVRRVGEHAAERAMAPFHVPVTAHKQGLADEDFTQRSRSFLYACIGAAVGDLFKLSELWFYENGVTSVNLPLCGQEVGGRATRTTHPQVLHGFGRILSLVFDRPFEAKNGFFWQTKQDVLNILRRYHRSDLAPLSVSCSHTRQITNTSPHCGMCSQCLSRRIAALGAGYGAEDPVDGYRKNPLTHDRVLDEERILAERFIGQARQVARMTSVIEFTTRYAGELSRVYPYLNMSTTVAAERLFDLHLRHAEQTGATMVQQISAHAQDHWMGRLGETSALAYAFDTGKGGRRRGSESADDAAGAQGPEAPDTGGASLVIDGETFTVTAGDRNYVFRGRSKQLFSLLERIGRRPGHRVWFDQLREQGDVWNGSNVEDVTIRGAFGRLRQELRGAGMEGLAQAIKTSTLQSRAFVVFDLASQPAGSD